MKVIKTIKDTDGYSVLLQDKDIQVWIDCYLKEDEYVCEWNKYIFFMDSEIDMKIKAFQEDILNVDRAFSLANEAIEKYEELK